MSTLPARRAAVPTALAVLFASVLAGCSLDRAAGQGPAASEPPDVRPLSGAASFSHAEAVRLHDLEEQAIAPCMAARGQRYTPQPRVASARSEETNPYGLLGPRKAAADGYGIVGEYLYLRSSPPPSGDDSRAPAWRRALTGTAKHRVSVRLPDGSRVEYFADGCVARARAEVYGADWDRTEPVVAALSTRVLAAVEKAPDYRAAIRRWSACMAEAGHPAADPQAPRARLNRRLAKAAADPTSLRALGREEIRTATADARCQARAELAETIGGVQRSVEKRVLSAAERSVVARHVAAKRDVLKASVTSGASRSPGA
ncbi:hypothetical protein [Streptomyces avermitilis]|uniref:hypothetical protein n=1 Tax=Streptomyces avermitilis TaxID=33903 RepID=UPI0033BBD7F3